MELIEESLDVGTISRPTEGYATFYDELKDKSLYENSLSSCIQCGTCGGSCPSANDMEHTPRQIFAMIRAGMREEVLKSNTPWYCVSCYLCTVRCPQDVKITDIMYTLKSMAIEEGYAQVKAAKDFSESFISYVEEHGRSFELGLATGQFLRHRPMKMVETASMGLGMMTKGRLDLTPKTIGGITQLKAILSRAKNLEEK